MAFITHHLLSASILLPVLGAIVALTVKTMRAAKWVGLAAASFTLALALLLPAIYDWHRPTNAVSTYAVRSRANPFGVVQWVERDNWVSRQHIHYFIGLDGLSLPLVLLTTFICMLASFGFRGEQTADRRYPGILLLFEAAFLGVFVSLDLLLFLAFLAASLVFLHILARLGRDRERHSASGLKFPLAMLIAWIAIAVVAVAIHNSAGSADLVALPNLLRINNSPGGHPFFGGKLLFAGLLLGFGILAGVVPLHAWVLDAWANLPPRALMIIASLLPAVGIYGISRVAVPMFPDAAKSLWLVPAALGVTTLVYAALVAIVERELPRIFAYGSICQMGIAMVGAAMMTPAGLYGAMFILVSHGVTVGLLARLARLPTDMTPPDAPPLTPIPISMPFFKGFMIIGLLAMAGLPLLCTFVGEFLVLIGTLQAARPESILIAAGHASAGKVNAVAVFLCIGLVLKASAAFRTIHRLVFVPPPADVQHVLDLNQREIGMLASLSSVAILLGVLPGVFFFPLIHTTVHALQRSETTAISAHPKNE